MAIPMSKIALDINMQIHSPYFRIFHLYQPLPGFFLQMHMHSFYHMNFVLSGSVTVTTEGETRQVKKGHAMILPPNQYHELRSDEGYLQMGVDIWCQEDENGFYKLFYATFGDQFHVISTQGFSKSFEELRQYCLDFSELNRLKIINTIESMILHVVENASPKKNITFRNQFLSLISQEGGYNLTLAQMGKELGLSRTHLERLSQETFGCGAVEYCNKLKTMRICRYLEITDMSLRDIAEAMNFYSESHLIVFFKKRMHVTPSQHRREYQSYAP